jgi:WD40 repeat protein
MTEPEAHPQGEIWQEVTEPRYAAISATGDSIITITNYYGGQLPTESTPSLGRTGLVSDDECPCPYRELYPFDQNDAALFFGREAATERLRQALRRRNVLPLLGASGSGKSSLVFAGLVPLLHKEGHWCYSYFRPRESPFMELARALLPLYAPSLNETERLGQTEQLAAKLRKKEILLSNVLAEIRHKAPHDQLLLIGDQFEELYYPTLMQEERQAFLDVLFQAFAHDGLGGRKGANASAGSVRLLLTMRADFLGNALAHRSFAALFQQEGEGKDDVKLGPMSEVELREAIEKPAAAQGVAFESGLVERILIELATEPGHLPLLEFALTKLWSRRKGALITHEAYTEIGGVKGALAQHADGCLADLEPSQQVEARRVFLQLVRPGEGTEDTRRLATRQELGEDRWPLVCLLADDRLVVTSRNAVGDDTVEVVHEALIRHWGKMRGWLASDRDFRSWQERLRGSLAQWQANDHEEGGLLRGAALAVARAQLQERQEDLGNIEQDFIAASAAAEDEARRRERRRQRLLFSGLAGGLVLVTVALMLAWGQLVRAQRQRGEALAASAKLNAPKRPADALFEALAAAGLTRFGHIQAATLSLPARVSEALTEGWGYNRETNRLLGHTARVYSAAFSTEGSRIVSTGEDGTLRVWDAKSGKPIGKPLELPSDYQDEPIELRSVAFSRDGSRIVASGRYGFVCLWDVRSGKQIKILQGHKGFVKSVSFSPDGQRILSSAGDGTIRVWDAKSGKSIGKPLRGHQGDVLSAAFSSDGSRIVSAGDDLTVRVWDAKTGKALIDPFRGHQDVVRSVAFSPDGGRIVSGGNDGSVRIWDVSSGKGIGEPLRGHDGWVNSVAFSPDGELIMSAGGDGTVRLWNAMNKEMIGSPLRGHQADVYSASFSKDGRKIVSAGEDKTVRIWDVNINYTISEPLGGHLGQVNSVAVSTDGSRIVSAGEDGTVRLWDAKSGKPIGLPLRGNRRPLWSVAISTDGKRIVSGGDDLTVQLWDAKSGRRISEPLRGHKRGLGSVAFSSNGDRIVSSGNDGEVRVWDAKSGKVIGIIGKQQDDFLLPMYVAWVKSAVFSPDGSLIATAGEDGLKLWKARSGKEFGAEIFFLGHHYGRVLSVAFSPNGRRIASAGGDDETVRVWDVEDVDSGGSGMQLGEPLRGHHKGVWSVAFSPNGSLITSGGEDGTVRVWNSKTGKQIGQPLRGHEGWVRSVTFTPDGARIVSSGQDGTIRIWDPGLTDPIRLACSFLRHHQSLETPSNDVEIEAQRTCRRWGWNK